MLSIQFIADITRSKNYGEPLGGYPNDSPGNPRVRHAGGTVVCPNDACQMKTVVTQEQIEGSVSIGCGQCGAHYYICDGKIQWLDQNYRHPRRR